MTLSNPSPLASTRVQDAGTRSCIQRELPPNTTAETYFCYPMYVKYRKELSVQQELESNEFRTFIPMESFEVKRGSKVCTEQRPAVHNMIFVYSYQKRITWMKMYSRLCEPLQYMSRPFLDGTTKILTIPQRVMENFIRAATLDDPLGQRSYLERPIDITDVDRSIKFVSGSFKGVEGILKRVDKNRAMILPLANGVNMKITITHASDIEFL